MAGRLIITAVTTITVTRSITMGAIRTEAIQCGRTSPLQSRRSLRRRCGLQGITVIRTQTMAATLTITRTMAQAMAMLVRPSLRCSGGLGDSVFYLVQWREPAGRERVAQPPRTRVGMDWS